jgi:DNA-binding response OmpR family regulator
MKVLLIDERPDALEFLCESVINFGYKTGTAKSGTEIVPMLLDDQYEVVLTNGGCKEIDIQRDVRVKCPSVFIVLLTGSYNKDENNNHGVDLYLRRPFGVSILRQAISNPLSH